MTQENLQDPPDWHASRTVAEGEKKKKLHIGSLKCSFWCLEIYSQKPYEMYYVECSEYTLRVHLAHLVELFMVPLLTLVSSLSPLHGDSDETDVKSGAINSSTRLDYM